MVGCRFSRVPKWIGHLQKLRTLHLGAKQIFQEDVAIIERGSSSLIQLGLQITSIPTERIVIGGSTGFPLVKLFDFDCDGISHLTFEEGAMPELRELSLAFDADKWDKAAPGGLQHLPIKMQAGRSAELCRPPLLAATIVGGPCRRLLPAINWPAKTH
jgi:hypothetical protein